MRTRFTLFCVLAAALAGVASSTAGAVPPLHATETLDIVFVEPFLSGECGQDVTLSVNGTFKATVFRNKDGITRELDTQPSLKVTYSSDAGKSISFPFSIVSHTDYPQGVFAGAPAVLTLTGNLAPFSGFVGPGNGRLVLNGDVVDVDQNGAPLTEFTSLLSQQGNFTTGAAKICAALAM